MTGPDDADDGTDSLRTRLTEWVFLTGNRWVLAAGILAVFLAVLVAIEFRTNSSGQQLVPLFYLASAIIGGNFTLLTIIISISQLVISRQLSAPGELEEQIENTTAYRDASVKLVDKEVPPPTPAAFLDVLLHGVRDAAEQLDSQRENIASDDAVTAIDRVLDPLRDQLDQSIHHLERDDVSIFEALVSTLDTNYSEDIHQIWRLEHAYENEITPEAKRCLEELVTRLKQIDVARQYLKTVYMAVLNHWTASG